MGRTLLRLVLVVVLLVGIVAFFSSSRWAGSGPRIPDSPVGTTGTPEINTERAREAGAELGEKLGGGSLPGPPRRSTRSQTPA